MSARISGVKNFESQTASLLRAVPFSHVQSAYANGVCVSIAGADEAAACVDEPSLWGGASGSTGEGVDTGSGILADSLVTAMDFRSAPERTFNADSSSAIRAFMISSSLVISAGTAGSGTFTGDEEAFPVVALPRPDSSDDGCADPSRLARVLSGCVCG